MNAHSSAAVIIASIGSAVLTWSASADTINVPVDQPTIQAAIEAAVPGDTVLVAPGTYIENIDFRGKDITVTSSGGADVTIIDGGQASPVVMFVSGETQAALLSGFTLRNGHFAFLDGRSRNGGGVNVDFSSPTIKNNRIVDNIGFRGGGIFIGGAGSAQILDNVIANNLASGGRGGGILMFSAGTPTIRGNLIIGNATNPLDINATGGGIHLSGDTNAIIVQNVIVRNESQRGAGIAWLIPSAFGVLGPMLVNNTIVNNPAMMDGSQIVAAGFDRQTLLINNNIVGTPGGTAVFCDSANDPNPPVFEFNNVFSPSGFAYGGICGNPTGSNGNISADPLFVDQATDEYRLGAFSPAVDAGDNTAPELPMTDFDGNLRIFDGDSSGEAIVDIGAFERQTADPVTPEILTRNLINVVIALGLQPRTEASLSRPLQLALAKLTDAKPNNDDDAVRHFQTFIARVEIARRLGQVSNADADALVAAANRIIDLLGAGEQG